MRKLDEKRKKMSAQDVERLQLCRGSICNDVSFESIAPALISLGLINREELQQIQAKDSDTQRMSLVLKFIPLKGAKALTKFTTILNKNYCWIADQITNAKPVTTTNDYSASTSSSSSSNNTSESEDCGDCSVGCGSGRSESLELHNQTNSNTNEQPTLECNQRTSINCNINRPTSQDLIIQSNSGNNNDTRPATAEQLNQKLSTDMLNLVGKNYRVAQKWTSLAHTLQLDSHIAPIRMKILVFSEDTNLSITYLLKEWMSQCPQSANLGNLLSALRQNNFNDVADDLEQKFIN